MSNLLEVSKATLEDLQQIAILFNEYRIFYKQPTDLEKARAFLLERIEKDESVIFKVKDGELSKVIGFTQLYPSFSSISMKRSWILNDLYVLEEFRGRGAAQQLLDAAQDYANSTCAKGLSLSTAIDNIVAQRIYERNGYQRDNEFYNYYLTL
ncbi:N-acetyltransferase family protein [Cohnella sp.]|uniref:GNAT family N-acetyltransferase n=1 Tax=Cohnella sp. TaxID=1883426 RepID=UPI003569B863